MLFVCASSLDRISPASTSPVLYRNLVKEELNASTVQVVIRKRINFTGARPSIKSLRSRPETPTR